MLCLINGFLIITVFLVTIFSLDFVQNNVTLAIRLCQYCSHAFCVTNAFAKKSGISMRRLGAQRKVK